MAPVREARDTVYAAVNFARSVRTSALRSVEKAFACYRLLQKYLVKYRFRWNCRSFICCKSWYIKISRTFAVSRRGERPRIKFRLLHVLMILSRHHRRLVKTADKYRPSISTCVVCNTAHRLWWDALRRWMSACRHWDQSTSTIQFRTHLDGSVIRSRLHWVQVKL